MSESAKALIGGLIFFSAIGALVAWCAPDRPSTSFVWIWRLGLPLLMIIGSATLLRVHFRKDVEPDLLRRFFPKPFERDGVCFSIVPSVSNGIAFMNIAFQNQYSLPCIFRVVVSPPMFAAGFDGVTMDIECEGGVFGVARTAIGIPSLFQGRKTRFAVAAATHYEHGKGKLLRFRNGLRAGKADTSGLTSAALTVGLLMLGHLHFRRSAVVACDLPHGVTEAVPESVKPTVHNVWLPGESVDAVEECFKAVLSGE